MQDIPTITPDKVIEKIINKKTGEVYKNDNGKDCTSNY